MAWIQSAVTLFILTLIGADGAKILAYFPTPSISHQIVYRSITTALARRGHEVIVVTTDPLPKENAPKNLIQIDVHDVSYKHWEEMMSYHTGEKLSVYLEIKLFFEKLATVLKVQMDTPGFQEILGNKDRKYFDLLLLEAINRPLIGISHLFDAPVIQISSFGAVEHQLTVFGAPIHPFLYPTVGRQRLYNLTIWEKIMEILKTLAVEYMLSECAEFDRNEMKRNFGEDVPDFVELTKKIQMLFINEHPIWADNRPFPPNMLYIGGIHQGIDAPLPEDLKQYLDSSQHGVIYVSFGTNVLPSLLPKEKIKIMSKVFSKLPYDILWKWDNSTLPELSSKIKVSEWFPQRDLLKHPNVKLFITQGGLQSTDETINAAVPAIGIPMLGDQWYNVEKYVRHGIGLQLDITPVTEEELYDAITTVINDKSFKDNILKLRSLMREFPIKPEENAVWWIEHVIKYGGSHLRSPAAGVSWAEYYEINLVMLILGILLIVVILLGYILKLFLRLVYRIFITDKKLKRT